MNRARDEAAFASVFYFQREAYPPLYSSFLFIFFALVVSSPSFTPFVSLCAYKWIHYTFSAFETLCAFIALRKWNTLFSPIFFQGSNSLDAPELCSRYSICISAIESTLLADIFPVTYQHFWINSEIVYWNIRTFLLRVCTDWSSLLIVISRSYHKT